MKYIFVFALTFVLANAIAVQDSTCVADFSFQIHEEIGKPSVIQFTNQSTGNPTQYNWDFGDGSISSAKDPVHYFPENGNFQVRLIIANNSSSDQMIKNVEINVPLSVDFSFKLDSNNRVPNTFLFTGIIEGYYDQIIWNFGDQILQDVKDTVHSYAQEDHDYQVTLTAQYFYNDTSVMTKALAKGLTTFEYFDLGGQVFLDDILMNNPVNQSDTGIAYLYRVDGSHLSLIDTNIFQKLGYYWFDNKLKAHYIVQVSLESNSTHAGDFAPTYVGNTTSWDEAEIINLAQDKFREDVKLINKNELKNGSNKISGYVNELIELDKDEKVLVCLYTTENILIDYQFNSSFSTYEFNHLEKGHYIIEADHAGVYSRPQLIYLDDSKNNEFKSLDNFSSNNIFPNPANDYTLLNYDNYLQLSEIEIGFYNTDGNLLKTEWVKLALNNNIIHLNLDELPKGILYLKTNTINPEIFKLIHY